MGNFGSSWARAAQLGTLAVVLAGCSSSDEDPKPDAMAPVDADDGEVAACEGAQRAFFGAWARFEDHALDEQRARLDGIVEAIEARDAACRGALSWTEIDADGYGYAVTIADGESSVSVELCLPWRAPIVSVGDHVSVEQSGSSGGIETAPSWAFTLRDEGGELLFWFVTAIGGLDQFDTPEELAIGEGEVACKSDYPPCPTTRRGVIVQNERSRRVEVDLGAMEDVGRYVVLNGDNTASQCEGSSQPYYHDVKLAAVRGSKASLAARDEDLGDECGTQLNEADATATDFALCEGQAEDGGIE